VAEPFDPYHKWLGISPKDQPPNHYRLLGIDLFEADLDVIEAAVAQRISHVRTYHLGAHGDLSQKILNEIAVAKVCLLHPEKKAAYDEELRGKVAPMVMPLGAPTPRRSPRKLWQMPVIVGTPIVLVLLAAAIAVTRRHSDLQPPAEMPKEPKLQQQPRTVDSLDDLASQQPQPPTGLTGETTTPASQQPDPQRAAAKWILDSGGRIKIRFGGERREMTRAADLPDQPIIVVEVDIQHDRSFSDEDFIHFESLANLEQAKFGATSVTGTGFNHLPKTGTLRTLILWDAAITDEGLEQIGKFASLTYLNIGNNRRLTGVGLRHVTGLTRLQNLELGYTNVTDEGLAHAAELTGLTRLSLHSTKVTDEGLVHLPNLRQLKDLNLMGTKVTDEGLDPLKSLKNLKSLGLPGTNVTEERARSLGEKLAGCKIRYGE